MKGKITLQNMVFYGYHGVYDYESQYGQRFYVDVELWLDISQAAQQDDLNQTVDYTLLYTKIKELVETKQFKLLEALAGAIAEIALINEQVTETAVRVRKPAVPLPGQVDYVQVELQRRR